MHHREEDQQDDPEGYRRLPARPRNRTRRRHACKADVSTLCDSPDQSLDTRLQPCTVTACPEFRRHHQPDRLARVAVRDPLLEAIPDFDLDATLLDRDQNEQSVVLVLVTDPSTVVLEHLHGHLGGVGIWLEGFDRRHHHRVAGGREQRPRYPIDLRCTGRVDHVGKVVDRLRQLGQRFPGLGTGGDDRWNEKDRGDQERV